MEFCVNWNKSGSTCECESCLGPWLETRQGFWQHAFDKLLFSYIKPMKNVIPLEEPDTENYSQDRDNESPVSSIKFYIVP